MLGPIIAAPLAMPVTVIVCAADRDVAAANLGHGVGRHHAAGGPFERRFVVAKLGGDASACRRESSPSAASRR